jgi:hypothetical protein
MSRLSRIIALVAAGSLATAAAAQEITAGGAATARVGYGDNPFLQINPEGSSAIVGGSLSGWLQRRSETATTRLSGVASLDQYVSHYGSAENYLASLSHLQQLTTRLSISGVISYQDAINARGFGGVGGTFGGIGTGIGTGVTAVGTGLGTGATGVDTDGLAIGGIGTGLGGVGFGGTSGDLLSIGQRTRSVFGSGQVNWAPTARDSFYVGPQYTHSTYPGLAASDFTQYGVRGGYLRTVNARLKVGVDLLAQRVNSDGFPDSTSYQASLRLVYDFNAIWQFDGTVGLINQRTSAPISSSSSTIGFTARICGRYPRYQMCFEAARQSAPSGFGGLRTDNRAQASGQYDLSARSRLTAAAVYDRSTSSSGVSLIPRQTYWEVSAGYSRTLTQRLSAGFSGRYQYRDFGNFAGLTDSSVTGYAVTLDATYRFGRLE